MWLAAGFVTVAVAVIVCVRVLTSAFDEEVTRRPRAIRNPLALTAAQPRDNDRAALKSVWDSQLDQLSRSAKWQLLATLDAVREGFAA